MYWNNLGKCVDFLDETCPRCRHDLVICSHAHNHCAMAAHNQAEETAKHERQYRQESTVVSFSKLGYGDYATFAFMILVLEKELLKSSNMTP